MKFQNLAALDKTAFGVTELPTKEVKKVGEKSVKQKFDKYVKGECLSLPKQLEQVTERPEQLTQMFTEWVDENNRKGTKKYGYSQSGLLVFRTLNEGKKQKPYFSTMLSFLKCFRTPSEQKNDKIGRYVSVNTLIERAITQRAVTINGERRLIGFLDYLCLFHAKGTKDGLNALIRDAGTVELPLEQGQETPTLLEVTKVAPFTEITNEAIKEGALILKAKAAKWNEFPVKVK
jgi:hypothetical protein